MERTTPARLLVAVSPVLLADVLCRALRFEGVDVVLYDTDESAVLPAPHDYAVALVSGELPEHVSAHAVIRLPEEPAPDLGAVVDLVRSGLDGYVAGPAGSSIR